MEEEEVQVRKEDIGSMIETGTEIGIENEKEIEIETGAEIETGTEIKNDQTEEIIIETKSTGRPALPPLNLGTNSTARQRLLLSTTKRYGKNTNLPRIQKSSLTKSNK